MDDEFALCWNNFQDNIASGFQNLYDRGDLVDVTLACDGKLLQAHKIVLAICSPYFQEIFVSNPCKHPIIILKDVTYIVMSELLQFMYQGVVNVKHTDLGGFMKIAQALQIKGLTTSMQRPSAAHSPATQHHSPSSKGSTSESNFHSNLLSASNVIETKISSALFAAKAAAAASEAGGSSGSAKRPHDYGASTSAGDGPLSIHRKKAIRRSSDGASSSLTGATGGGDHDLNESMENMSSDDVFMPPIPQISMSESSRFDLNNVKRETGESMLSPSSVMRLVPPPFNFEYSPSLFDGSGGSSGRGAGGGIGGGSGSKTNVEYPNDLHMSNDYIGKGGSGNHMDIPPVAPGEKWCQGKLEFMLSQRGKPLLVHDGHTFGIQYVRKDKKYWQCNLSRKFNCKARVTTTENGEIIVTNNEHCHTEIRQHLRKDYKQQQQQLQQQASALITSPANTPLAISAAGSGALSLVVTNHLAKNAMNALMASHHHQQQQQHHHQLLDFGNSLQPPVAHQSHPTWPQKDEIV